MLTLLLPKKYRMHCRIQRCIRHMLALLFLPLCFMGGSASVHLMPAQKGTINVIDNAAYVVLSLPVSALRGIDPNQDGRLTGAELIQHRSSMESQVKQGLRLYDGKVVVQVEFIQINNTHDEVDEHHLPRRVGGSQLLAMVKIRFVQALKALRLETDLFGKEAIEQQFTLRWACTVTINGSACSALIWASNWGRHCFWQRCWRWARYGCVLNPGRNLAR